MKIDAFLFQGASIRHENVIAAITGQKERVFPIVNIDEDIFIAYLPLGHIFELCCGMFSSLKRAKPNKCFCTHVEILVFYAGVKSGYGSPQTLTDQSTMVQKGQKGDLQALRPYIMNCVPVSPFELNNDNSSISFD